MQAKEHSLAYCSLASGCSLALLALNDNLGSFERKYLASEAYAASVNTLQNKGYSADMTLLNAFSAAVDVGCERESQGFWGALTKGASCLSAATIAIERAAAYFGCLSRTKARCLATTRDWYNAPSQQLEQCKEQIARISESENVISRSKKIIEEKKATLTWRLFGGE